MEKTKGNWIWTAITFALCIALIMISRFTFEQIFPEVKGNSITVYIYLLFIMGAVFHYRKDEARVKITILFIIIPLALMFLLTWIFKDYPEPYGNALKFNLPRSVLVSAAIVFFYYTMYINPSDTLKNALRKQEQAQRKKDWQEKNKK